MRPVAEMYSRHPFPKRSSEGARKMTRYFAEELSRLGVSLESLQGQPVLDAGCGTGEIASFVASKGPKVFGLDFSDGSLKYAHETSPEIRFLRGSILEPPLKPSSFDFIYSHMVLHHTGDPERGVQKLSRALRPGGHFLIKVFSLFGRGGMIKDKGALWRILLVRALAKDVEARVRWAERLFYKPRHEESHGLTKATYLYDNFGVPIVSHHTYGQILKWFRRAGVEYVASDPPMEFGRMVEGLGGRGTRLRRLGLHRVLRNPNTLSRALSQTAMLAMQGISMVSVLGRKT